MTNQEAIKYLQQLYPNGGHCWLDEQRIEAIGMAVKALQEEPESIWHDANEEPNNMSHCLVFYGEKSLIGHYLHYEPVLYNKQDKVFVTVAYPHQTGYKVEQKSLDGGCVAEVYKDKRDRISISDITSWCYLNDLHNFTQKEEPAIEDLGEYINELSKQFPEVSFAKLSRIAVRVAKWQKKHLWKPADGDDLPEIDREVVVLEGIIGPTTTDCFYGYKVVFAHRPNPNGWDGKSIATGNIEHYTPKTYGKGGWNIPDVKYWLDVELPKETEL